jgi:hypothetical protein
MNKKKCAFPIILLAFIMLSVLVAAHRAQEKSLAEIFQTGKARLIPEVTITEESMAGKDFFSSVMDIALDEQGSLYACDFKENNIKKFNTNGSFLGTIGRPGQGPGEFNGPIEVEWSKGQLYIRELMNMRVSILDSSGQFVKSCPIDMFGGTWLKMRALPDGRFLVQKEKANRKDMDATQEMSIDLYSPEFKFIKTVYQHEVRTHKYVTEPRYSGVAIPFAASVFWEVAPSGKVIIGYSGKYEFEIHDPDKGKVSLFSHTYSPVEVTAKDKELLLRGTVSASGLHLGTSENAPRVTEFPRYKPAYHSIKIDAEGNIWVQLYASVATKAVPRMDVFDCTGRFLNSVRFVEGAVPHIMAPRSNGFWAATIAKNDEWVIIKYRISE